MLKSPQTKILFLLLIELYISVYFFTVYPINERINVGTRPLYTQHVIIFFDFSDLISTVTHSITFSIANDICLTFSLW